MVNFLKLFQKPSPEEAAAATLVAARHTLLEAQSNVEYWQAITQAMEKRIARLADYSEKKGPQWKKSSAQ